MQHVQLLSNTFHTVALMTKLCSRWSPGGCWAAEHRMHHGSEFITWNYGSFGGHSHTDLSIGLLWIHSRIPTVSCVQIMYMYVCAGGIRISTVSDWQYPQRPVTTLIAPPKKTKTWRVTFPTRIKPGEKRFSEISVADSCLERSHTWQRPFCSRSFRQRKHGANRAAALSFRHRGTNTHRFGHIECYNIFR